MALQHGFEATELASALERDMNVLTRWSDGLVTATIAILEEKNKAKQMAMVMGPWWQHYCLLKDLCNTFQNGVVIHKRSEVQALRCPAPHLHEHNAKRDDLLRTGESMDHLRSCLRNNIELARIYDVLSEKAESVEQRLRRTRNDLTSAIIGLHVTPYTKDLQYIQYREEENQTEGGQKSSPTCPGFPQDCTCPPSFSKVDYCPNPEADVKSVDDCKGTVLNKAASSVEVTTSKDVADAEQGMSVRVSDIVETCGRSLGDLQANNEALEAEEITEGQSSLPLKRVAGAPSITTSSSDLKKLRQSSSLLSNPNPPVVTCDNKTLPIRQPLFHPQKPEQVVTTPNISFGTLRMWSLTSPDPLPLLSESISKFQHNRSSQRVLQALSQAFECSKSSSHDFGESNDDSVASSTPLNGLHLHLNGNIHRIDVETLSSLPGIVKDLGERECTGKYVISGLSIQWGEMAVPVGIFWSMLVSLLPTLRTLELQYLTNLVLQPTIGCGGPHDGKEDRRRNKVFGACDEDNNSATNSAASAPVVEQQEIWKEHYYPLEILSLAGSTPLSMTGLELFLNCFQNIKEMNLTGTCGSPFLPGNVLKPGSVALAEVISNGLSEGRLCSLRILNFGCNTLPISSWMKLFKSLCSTNSIVEVFDIVNGMVFVDENAEETAEVGAPCSIADLEKCHHHLYCLRAKGICRTLSHALAGYDALRPVILSQLEKNGFKYLEISCSTYEILGSLLLSQRLNASLQSLQLWGDYRYNCYILQLSSYQLGKAIKLLVSLPTTLRKLNLSCNPRLSEINLDHIIEVQKTAINPLHINISGCGLNLSNEEIMKLKKHGLHLMYSDDPNWGCL